MSTGNRCRAALAGFLLAFLAFLAPLRGQETGPGPVVVSLRPRAVVGNRAVLLGDVADLSGGTPALRQALAALDLADAPSLKAGLTLTRQVVAYRIQLGGVPGPLFLVEGAGRVEVRLDQCQLAVDEVVAVARDALLRRLSRKPDDVSVSLAQPVSGPLAVAGSREDVTLLAEPHAAPAAAGRVQMDVSVLVRGEKRLAFPVYLDVRPNLKVAVCARKIEPGEVLGEADVTFESRAPDAARHYLTSAESLAGKRARQALLPGQPVCAADVEEVEGQANLVRQRDAVKMVVHLGALNVFASGEALQDGRKGQLIRVRNLDSKQVVVGKVAGKQLVEIEP